MRGEKSGPDGRRLKEGKEPQDSLAGSGAGEKPAQVAEEGTRKPRAPVLRFKPALAQDSLQVRIRGGNGFDLEVFHQHVQDVGGDEGRE